MVARLSVIAYVMQDCAVQRAVSGVFAVTMNVVVFVHGGVRVIVGHRLAVGVGICVVFVAGMIRVVGVVCFPGRGDRYGDRRNGGECS